MFDCLYAHAHHRLQVDREDLRAMTHEHALQVLRHTDDIVRLVVMRDVTEPKHDDINDEITVTLNKKSGKGIGVCLVERAGSNDVLVSDIVSGTRFFNETYQFLATAYDYL